MGASPRDAMRSAALELAAHGWRVFPCKPRGPEAKSPYTRHGHLEATDDPETIIAWWMRWPEALIGAPVPDRLVAIDVDPRNGGSISALEVLAGPLPATLTVWSGRNDGGQHLYYRRPTEPLTGKNLPEGIDLKASGYLILPPSIHPASGMPYRWEVRDPALLTSSLLALLRQTPVSRYLGGKTASTNSGGPLIRLVLSLSDGERNRGLFWAACRASDDGILPRIAEELISAAVSVGLPEREARRTVASAASVRRTA